MKSIADIPFEKLYVGMPVKLKDLEYKLHDGTGKIVYSKDYSDTIFYKIFQYIEPKSQLENKKRVIIDWDNGFICDYSHPLLTNVFVDEERL